MLFNYFFLDILSRFYSPVVGQTPLEKNLFQILRLTLKKHWIKVERWKGTEWVNIKLYVHV